MEPEVRILSTGTMRTGGSLLSNLLCSHPKIFVFGERIHFFRFYYNKFNPLNKKSTHRLLEQMRIRLQYRFEIPLDVDSVMAAVLKRGISYASIYDEVMKYYLGRVERTIWGEYVAMQWRSIPAFVNMYDNARAIHIYRDPRSVMSSWKKTAYQTEHQHLNTFFNWLDSAQCVERYSRELPASKYLPIKYEDIMAEPEKHTRQLCEFIGVDFQAEMLQPETWHGRLPTQFLINPKSAHEGENIRGFSTSRTKNWVKNLDDSEISVLELVCHDQMKALGYEFHKEAYSPTDVNRGLVTLGSEPKLLMNLHRFLASGEGTPLYFYDPTDPKYWAAARHNISQRFLDAESDDANGYFEELAALEAMLDEKYGK